MGTRGSQDVAVLPLLRYEPRQTSPHAMILLITTGSPVLGNDAGRPVSTLRRREKYLVSVGNRTSIPRSLSL
jgi:hypothetical protein